MNELESRLHHAMHTRLRQHASLLEAKTAKLWQHSPTIAINSHKQRLHYLDKRLASAIRHRLEHLSQRLLNASQTLNAVSPLSTLSRGYAMAIHLPSGRIIRSTESLKAGDMIQTRLAQGQFTSQIKTIDRD